MKFLDLFAGIGGFRLGMEAASHECVGYVEIDKFARKSYEAIHNTEGEWTAHDITTVTNDDLRSLRGKVDVICGGFPCQAFSIAGKRLGFAETRGTLFFEIARLAKEIQPQYLFLENVKGLLNHDGGSTFRTILSTLDELGYDAEWQLLNSKDIGPKPVPQNRERVFIIGHLRGRSRREVFPIRRSCTEIDDSRVVTGTLTTRYPESQREGTYIEEIRKCKRASGEVSDINSKVVVKGMLDIKGKDQIRRVYRTEGISPCLTTMQGGGQEPKVLVKEATKKGYAEDEIGDSINYSVPNSKTRRGRVGKGIAQTLDTACNQATIENKPPYRIRKLTPRECWRLQGFPRIKMEGYLCISNVKFVEQDSNTKREEKHVQNNVHISYEGKTLVIHNQEKSYKFANGVVVNDLYHLPIRTESFVALLVGMNLIQEKIVRSGTEMNSIDQSHMSTIKEWLKSEDGLLKIESVVNAVEKDVKTNQNSMHTTKEVLNTKNLDTIYRTLSYFVEVVIQKFMCGEKKSLLEIEIDWDWAFDRAREVNSDSQLYKQAGNSVTVPVIYEIAKRLV